MPGKTTIRDIARKAGVSIATVSRVLNERPDVSESTRDTVLSVVRSEGFHLNRSARALSARSTGLIGVLLPVLHAEYFTTILAGAAEALHQRDMRVVLCPTQHEPARETTLLGRLMEGTTDGALLVLPSETPQQLHVLRRRGFPFVVIDPRHRLADDVPCVSAAHSQGAGAATEHLLDLGHRRIGVITGPPDWVANEQRMLGHRAALAGAAILPDATLIESADFEQHGGYVAARTLLGLADRPTAIFAFNDAMAIGAMQAARDLGLHIPQDVSVVGFDDSAAAGVLTPALTSVRQPLAEMGRTAVSLLTRLIAGDAVESLRVELATRLILRTSTAPPRTGC